MNGAGKIALVTGAGTGVGRAVSIALIREGYVVVLAGRRADKLGETAAAGAALGGQSLVVPTDVTEPNSVKGLFDRIRDNYGRLDLLFNNAGIVTPPILLEDLPFEIWQRVIATNLSGMFLCTQQAVRMMKSQKPAGGRIVNNGSVSAHTPRPRAVAYTASKHAVTGLTKQIALDCRGYNISCGQIDIGNAGTPLAAAMASGVLQPDGAIRTESRMDVDDIGRAVAYMASLPLDTSVLFMTVIPNQMPFVGRG
ncbi:SDR family oxidoreductase [Bradyrhizobium sp. 149]|uniref:SDR family oxidoreductase n=1 Tax=Bradyrhizobium sp. 149 TaxID=2782624 RepID=UPI001FF7D962|nr:SDR family oxidoreductase [Bradyrhizobium sp. 149]MCK1652930.1 SDR family oxidoreductase [Bradyrhizobium sp. 149]